MKTCFVAVCSLVVFAIFAVNVSAAQPDGVVVSVKPGAWAMRDGNRVSLDMKSQVSVGDVLITDANGHLQVMFADDSTVSVGPDTEVAVRDFVFESGERKASFSADVVKGFTRFVTGKVVEQNRSGFSVTTPQATVGIRGTTFAVNVSPEGISSIIGLDVNSSLPITVTNVKTGAISTIEAPGMAVDAASTGNTSYQTPPGQFSQSGSAVSSKAVAAGFGTGGQGKTLTDVSAGNQFAMNEPAPGNDNFSSLGPANARMLTDSAGKNPLETFTSWLDPNMHGPDHSSASGVYSGSLLSGGAMAGRFSFTALLSAGAGLITNAQMQLLGLGAIASQDGNPAVVSNGNFNIGMSVTDPRGESGLSVGNDASMSGGFNGPNVSGSWNYKHDDNSDFKGGTFAGSKQ